MGFDQVVVPRQGQRAFLGECHLARAHLAQVPGHRLVIGEADCELGQSIFVVKRELEGFGKCTRIHALILRQAEREHPANRLATYFEASPAGMPGRLALVRHGWAARSCYRILPRMIRARQLAHCTLVSFALAASTSCGGDSESNMPNDGEAASDSIAPEASAADGPLGDAMRPDARTAEGGGTEGGGNDGGGTDAPSRDAASPDTATTDSATPEAALVDGLSDTGLGPCTGTLEEVRTLGGFSCPASYDEALAAASACANHRSIEQRNGGAACEPARTVVLYGPYGMSIKGCIYDAASTALVAAYMEAEGQQYCGGTSFTITSPGFDFMRRPTDGGCFCTYGPCWGFSLIACSAADAGSD
jgi:hypothetical protein